LRRFLLLGTLAVFAVNAQVKFTRGTDQIAVEIDGKPFTTYYMAADGNKPYLYPLRTASGILVTRHFPMESFPGETHDHPHHRGLFFAHGDINGFNFWATEKATKTPNDGSMVLRKIVAVKGGAKSGTIKAVFDGLDPQGKPMMTETRTITFRGGPDLRIIDFAVVVKALQTLKFGDTKEGTFGIRLATAMTEDKGGKMTNAEGAETEKNVWGKRSKWVDYAGTLEGKPVGVTIMDNPANPRYPTYWHARAYGLFAANPFGLHDFFSDKSKDGSMTVEAGKSVTFKYRVVIHPGNTESANIPALYEQYVAK
jgi:hypothetical protein